MSNLDIMWEKTLEILGKVNAWIPLWAVLLSGLILVGVVLILAICSCALRKTLVPNWLIWIYFIFATIVIFAHTGNDVAAWVADMEVPVLVVLLCYLLRIVFRRRARYVYVEKEVYARRLAKGQVYQVAADGQQVVTIKKNKKEKPARGVKKETKVVEVIETTEVVNEENANREKAERERVEREKAEREAEAARIAAAEKAAREAREKEKVTEKAAAEKAVTEKAVKTENARPASVTRPVNSTTTSTFTTVDLPTVNPIPDKTYEPAREPMIVANPVSKTMPDLKIPTAPIQLRSSSASTTTRPSTRPASSNTTPVIRSTSTVTRPTTTTTTTTTNTGNNAFASMYNPRIVKTTTTTTNTTTSNNTNTVEAISASRTVNGNTTSATAVKATSSSNGTAPHSTEDIMAAIERLRASMKK